MGGPRDFWSSAWPSEVIHLWTASLSVASGAHTQRWAPPAAPELLMVLGHGQTMGIT